MDLPPSGWYPDPFGVTGLLRWWDGSTWTHHTHADAAPDAEGGGPAAAVQQSGTVQATALQARGALTTTMQPTTVQPTTVQPTTVQATSLHAAGQLTAAPPAASTLATTVPQPVLPPTAVQPAVEAAAPPAALQPAGVQPTTIQPTTIQPTTAQPAGQSGGVQPTTVQPFAMQGSGSPPTLPGAGRGHDGNGTQVLFPGDHAWPSGPGPGAAAGADLYGYQRAQRRRRIWVAGGLAGGTVVALGVIALVVNTLGQSSTSTTATQAPTQSAPVAAATSASPTASATTTGTASTLTDGQTGLTYSQLATPWQPTCPGNLNSQGFTWTAGESAVAGQVNSGQTTWYGEACSAPLPQQYGYNGVADLANVTTTLANQFNGAYYSALNHSYAQELSEPVQVSGHAGWEVKFLITYTNAAAQGVTWPDEMGAVVVADSGTGTAPAVFYVSVPNNLGETNVDTLVSSLQLSMTPQMEASASASAAAASASASASSAGPGNGGGGNNP